MPTPLKVKDATTVRDDILRTQRNGLINRGIASPQLGPGSSEYLLAFAVGQEIEVVNSNVQVKGEENMPDAATGSNLDRVCAIWGIFRQPATSSEGWVVLSTTSPTFIAAGAQLVDQTGQRFSVTTGGTYANLALVPVESVDTGSGVNHASGDVLRWQSTPPYAANSTVVWTAGLLGGADKEEDEPLRARLFQRLQNPPNNANWSQIIAIAEASSPLVEKGWCYPAVNGPATVHVAVARAPAVLNAATTSLNSTSKNRDIDSTTMNGTIIPTILGQMPEYVETVVTTVGNIPNSCAIALSLPAAPTAVPAGPGGGWIDGSPWPDVRSAPSNPASVYAVTSSTRFQVYAPTLPQANVTHVAFLDPTNWTLYRAMVLAVNGTTTVSGLQVVDITIDTPWPNITAGNYVFPDCVRAQDYVNAILAAFAALGPGEKTSVAANLTRGYRHPVPALGWQNALGPTQLRMLSDVGEEVLDVAWNFRSFTGPPAVPGSVANAPNIYVPQNIGFYQQ